MAGQTFPTLPSPCRSSRQYRNNTSPLAMASPRDPVAGPSGKEVEANNGEIGRPTPPNSIQLELALGGSVLVKIGDSNVKLAIHYDGLNRIRFSIDESDHLYPLTIKRPEGIDVLLSSRHYGHKFDFINLPAELRNKIYALVFPNVSGPTTEVFRNKRALKPLQFLARLNKTVTGGSALTFLNHQTVAETLAFLLNSKRFIIPGDKQALAFFKSLGPAGLANFRGPLVFRLHHWERADLAVHWSNLFISCRNLRELVFEGHSDAYYTFGSNNPFFKLSGCGAEAKFPKLERLVFNPPIDEEVHAAFLHFLTGEDDGDGEFDHLLMMKAVYAAVKTANTTRFSA
ncbi:uncharacterized protein J3D65DRAFT_601418 [Phyllosticta citribraziliensis]|uniref:Uncharacterized protein n=1 Tax=Phyllosticta citribraziliensis TaxID=989973 RepID=A0ABR1LVU9_9PEZI